jgi:hypothetical protein
MRIILDGNSWRWLEPIHPFSIPTVVALGLALSGKKDGVAATITDDRQVASVQYETTPLILCNQSLDGFTHLWRIRHL